MDSPSTSGTDLGSYLAFSCVDCSRPFVRGQGRGRPRIRCTACSPEQRRPAGAYVTDRSRSSTCANAECGAAFVAAHASVLYCSSTCRSRVCNVRAQTARRDRSSRKCRRCGDAFVPAYGDLRVRYCSRICMRRASYRSGHTHRRRAVKLGLHAEFFDKRRIFERDGWRCQLCGCSTPERLQGTRHPRAPELDHVTALANGGEHVPSNCQCSCRRCNQAKGSGPARGQRGLFA